MSFGAVISRPILAISSAVRGAQLAEVGLGGDQLLAGQVATALGKRLILKLDGRRARPFVRAYGAGDRRCRTIAGVAIGDQRNRAEHPGRQMGAEAVEDHRVLAVVG